MAFAKYSKYILYVLMGISVILIALLYLGGDVPGTEGVTPEPKITDTIIKFSYFLFIIAAGLAIVFLFTQLFTNPALLKRSAIVIVLIAVIYLIARGMASDELLDMKGYDDNVPNTLKNVGTGLISTYILIGITVFSMLYSEIAKFFK